MPLDHRFRTFTAVQGEGCQEIGVLPLPERCSGGGSGLSPPPPINRRQLAFGAAAGASCCGCWAFARSERDELM